MTRLGVRVPRASIILILLVVSPTGAAEALVPAAPVPEQFSAADQYVESVPTSSGPRRAKRGPAGAKGDKEAPLPPAAGNLGGTLREVATSPSLGAPERDLPNTSAPVDNPSVPSSAVNAIDDADGGRLIWLLLALLVVTGAIAGTATHRHHARRRPGT